ncbi:hypothetical protein Y1Q_0004143 [Alligator mississippiensis]|uniref:Uncharacterized protein n=1 Tax=Alligator mississippiensis TaxID=8496 RepID=A0A151PI35_ALLMI|nr:hypothetical protein Y1Q_0004143 [Alligator mississippiensis]
MFLQGLDLTSHSDWCHLKIWSVLELRPTEMEGSQSSLAQPPGSDSPMKMSPMLLLPTSAGAQLLMVSPLLAGPPAPGRIPCCGATDNSFYPGSPLGLDHSVGPFLVAWYHPIPHQNGHLDDSTVLCSLYWKI